MNDSYLMLIGADIVPTETNEALFEKGDAKALAGDELLDVMNSARYRVFNLEVPLTDSTQPLRKFGPCLIAPTASAKGIRAVGADLVTLANNHILDQSVAGLESTCRTLSENGISYIGMGSSLENLNKYVLKEIDGKKIIIYACAEHEFSIAGKDQPGVNPYDPLDTSGELALLKKKCDYLVVLYHGGKEHYRYPSPMLQKRCRDMAAAGADLIVCQHSHCIGCREEFAGAVIVYGQGNFLFDHNKSEFWQTSLLIGLREDLTVRFIPLRKQGSAVRLAKDDDATEILSRFEERSAQIRDPEFVEQTYRQFARENAAHYLRLLHGITRHNVFFHGLNKLTKGKWQEFYMTKKYNEKALLGLQNILECEAHSELMLCGIKELRKTYEQKD